MSDCVVNGAISDRSHFIDVKKAPAVDERYQGFWDIAVFNSDLWLLECDNILRVILFCMWHYSECDNILSISMALKFEYNWRRKKIFTKQIKIKEGIPHMEWTTPNNKKLELSVCIMFSTRKLTHDSVNTY